MQRPEIYKAYKNLEGNALEEQDLEMEKKGALGEVNLAEFIKTYAESLSAIIKAFPRGNLDINALEAHTWDRLRYYFQFERFKDVSIETKEEVKFINEAIKQIEEWFYKGEWTSCLTTPSEKEIQGILSGNKNSFLQRVRRVEDKKKYPNLGRDSRFGNKPPFPNIYESANSGEGLKQVYFEHAFKFFHGPASVVNTLTKISSRKTIVANGAKFDELRSSTFSHSIEKLKSWGYDIPKPDSNPGRMRLHPDVVLFLQSAARMNSKPEYIRPKQEYKRNLYFIKTSMTAAEMIRRTGEGELTKEGFQKIIGWLKSRGSEQQGVPDFIDFDFVAADNSKKAKFGYSSHLHFNSKEFLFALFAVDYLKQKQNSE